MLDSNHPSLDSVASASPGALPQLQKQCWGGFLSAATGARAGMPTPYARDALAPGYSGDQAVQARYGNLDRAAPGAHRFAGSSRTALA